MDLPGEKLPPDPATGRPPARPAPGPEASLPPDDDADLSIGEEVFHRRSPEAIPQGPPPPRDKKRSPYPPAHHDSFDSAPPSHGEEEAPRRRKNPLEKRHTAPLNEFKRVVRPQTAMAASAAVDHARAESPVPLESLERGAKDFAKARHTAPSPDYRPNKLHGVLDSAYRHSPLRWLDWVERIGPWVLIGTVVLLGLVGFLTWRYFESGGGGSGPEISTLGDTSVKGLTPAERAARGKATVQQFLQAQTVEARLPLVMDPDRARPRMEQFYGAMGGQNPGITSWEVGVPVASANGAWLPFVFTDNAGRKVTVALGETATGCIIDWENFTAFGEMPWQEFCRTKPSAKPQALRVRLRRSEGYDASHPKTSWQAYDIEHRSGGPKLTAYSSRTARHAQTLDDLIKGNQWQCALVYLQFDPAVTTDGIVIIADIIRSRWQDEATYWTGGP